MCRRGPGQQNSSTLFCNLKLGTTAGRGKSFSASFLSALSQHDLSAVRVGVVVEEFFILKQKKVILAVPLTCVTRHLRKLDCVCRLPWYSRARLLDGVRQVDGLPHPRRPTLWCNSEGLAPWLYSWAIKRIKALDGARSLPFQATAVSRPSLSRPGRACSLKWSQELEPAVAAAARPPQFKAAPCPHLPFPCFPAPQWPQAARPVGLSVLPLSWPRVLLCMEGLQAVPAIPRRAKYCTCVFPLLSGYQEQP